MRVRDLFLGKIRRYAYASAESNDVIVGCGLVGIDDGSAEGAAANQFFPGPDGNCVSPAEWRLERRNYWHAECQYRDAIGEIGFRSGRYHAQLHDTGRQRCSNSGREPRPATCLRIM